MATPELVQAAENQMNGIIMVFTAMEVDGVASAPADSSKKKEETIKIQTCDKVITEVPLIFARQFVPVRNMLDDVGEDTAKNDDSPIPIPAFDSGVMQTVLDFCKYREVLAAELNAPVVLSSAYPNEPPSALKIVHDFEKEETLKYRADQKFEKEIAFCQKLPTADALMALTKAANYLNFQPLLIASCNAVANNIKGKTPEQIRHYFNITHEFTTAEEEEIISKTAWCNDISNDPFIAKDTKASAMVAE